MPCLAEEDFGWVVVGRRVVEKMLLRQVADLLLDKGLRSARLQDKAVVGELLDCSQEADRVAAEDLGFGMTRVLSRHFVKYYLY